MKIVQTISLQMRSRTFPLEDRDGVSGGEGDGYSICVSGVPGCKDGLHSSNSIKIYWTGMMTSTVQENELGPSGRDGQR